MPLLRFVFRWGMWASSTTIGLFTMPPGAATAIEQEPVPLPPSPSGASAPALITQQPDPNRDRLLQPAPVPTPLPPEPTEPVLPTPAPNPTPEPVPVEPSISFPVTRIEVSGSTILTLADLEPITKPLEGRSVTLEELRQAADAITQLYLDRGFITSRAVLTEQTIQGGVVQIQVIEGSIAEIQIEGTQRLKQSYIRQRIELGAKTPLNRDKLEDQLRLLKADPLFTNVEASLRPGTQLGQSILIVRVTESKALTGFVGSDNYSPPSVGSVRLGAGLTYRNITGVGDEASATYYRTTTDGADSFDFTYRLPLNALNGTLQLRAAPSYNRITEDDFADLDIRGGNGLYELSFRQPVVRSPREELAFSLGLSFENGQTFLLQDTPFPFGIGPDADGKSITRVLKFGQDYVRRDATGAWAVRSQFSFGLPIFNATQNDAPTPDGRFFSWLGQVQRVQRLGAAHLLIVQGDLQLTPDSLLPSQQFVIGGGQSVRGYRQNARSGDNGFRVSIEDRIALARDEAGVPVFQVAPFFEAGKVWNKSDNPNRLPDQTFLAAVGVGLLWQPVPQFFLRFDYGYPIIKLDDRGGDIQDDGFYFSVYYQF